jgi:hypothetical protein
VIVRRGLESWRAAEWSKKRQVGMESKKRQVGMEICEDQQERRDRTTEGDGKGGQKQKARMMPGIMLSMMHGKFYRLAGCKPPIDAAPSLSWLWSQVGRVSSQLHHNQHHHHPDQHQVQMQRRRAAREISLQPLPRESFEAPGAIPCRPFSTFSSSSPPEPFSTSRVGRVPAYRYCCCLQSDFKAERFQSNKGETSSLAQGLNVV